VLLLLANTPCASNSLLLLLCLLIQVAAKSIAKQHAYIKIEAE